MTPREFPASSGDGQVTLRIADAVAHVLFDRPWARNAMTWAMYDGLPQPVQRLTKIRCVRVAVLRGAGGKAFVAGTDIAQFREFANGDDGVAYEAMLDGFVDTLERLRVPSIAVVEGFAVGAGLAIANACDIRIAASGARFGVPIARTLGNCLSAANLRRLCVTLGVSWVKRMLLLAEMPSAELLLPIGYLEAVVAQEALDAASCAALRPFARACATHHRGNTGNIATSRTCAGCQILATSLGPVTAVPISVAAPRRSALGRGSIGRGGNSAWLTALACLVLAVRPEGANYQWKEDFHPENCRLIR